MANYFFIGNAKPGKELEYAERALKRDDAKEWQVHPFADLNSNKILHIGKAGSIEEVYDIFPKDLYEVENLTEIMTTGMLYYSVGKMLSEEKKDKK